MRPCLVVDVVDVEGGRTSGRLQQLSAGSLTIAVGSFSVSVTPVITRTGKGLHATVRW